jgi:hypothetical protein
MTKGSSEYGLFTAEKKADDVDDNFAMKFEISMLNV